MDPETPRNTRYNLRKRKAKPEPRQGTSGKVLARYTRKRVAPRLKTTAAKGKGKRPIRRRAITETKEGMLPSGVGGGRHQRPKERVVTWQHDGSRIDDPANLPAQWDANEYDLDEHDIDGNIARCHLRIQENILPHMFEARLERYMGLKAELDAIIAAAPGLPWRVAQRLDDLRAIEKDLLNNDPQEQMVNVRAIIAAYHNGSLIWKRGTVTFWSHGTLVWGPGKFDWKTFNQVNKEHQGHTSFWVEECNPDMGTLFIGWKESPVNIYGQHNMRLRLRVPGIADPFATRVWDFMDDTGASATGIYACDLQELENAAHVKLEAFGHERIATASGKICVPAYHLQARLLADDDSVMLIPWTDLKIWVMPGQPTKRHPRLCGIWTHHLLYFANVPDNQGILYMCDKKSDLTDALPDVDATQATPPDWDYLEFWSDDEMDITL